MNKTVRAAKCNEPRATNVGGGTYIEHFALIVMIATTSYVYGCML